VKNAPILATIELWSLGHSASDIAERLGFPNHRHVARIIAHARSIGDPRAALHCGKSGKPLGRAGRGWEPPRRGRKTPRYAAELIPSIRALVCQRGHAQTARTIAANGYCLECRRMAWVPRKDRRG
jgi:hypothetical protein